MKWVKGVGLLAACLFASALFAGLRGPGKYDGVVFFDRWGTCILFSSTYLMYVSEAVKEPLRPYAGQSIELDVQSVDQPLNPGDGLIRKYGVLSPAIENPLVKVTGLELKARTQSTGTPGELGITMTIRNRTQDVIEVRGSELGFAVLTRRPRVADRTLDASDGESIALITRVNAETATGKGGSAIGDELKEYAFHLDPNTRLPTVISLRPGQEVPTTFYFDLPPGEYQFVAGYGGGVHQQKSIISNAVSFDVSVDRRITLVN